MRVWERKNYQVVEDEFDGDLQAFDVMKHGVVIATITPSTVDDMGRIVQDLDNGGCVDGWEDGSGGIVNVDLPVRTHVIYSNNVDAPNDVFNESHEELYAAVQHVKEAENTNNARNAHYYEEKWGDYDVLEYHYVVTFNPTNT